MAKGKGIQQAISFFYSKGKQVSFERWWDTKSAKTIYNRYVKVFISSSYWLDEIKRENIDTLEIWESIGDEQKANLLLTCPITDIINDMFEYKIQSDLKDIKKTINYKYLLKKFPKIKLSYVIGKGDLLITLSNLWENDIFEAVFDLKNECIDARLNDKDISKEIKSWNIYHTLDNFINYYVNDYGYS